MASVRPLNTDLVHTHKFDEPFLTPCDANFEQLTPVSFLERTATLFPQQPAYIYDALDLKITYATMHERCRKLAHTLVKQFGVRPGDVVSVLGPNTPAVVEAHFAIPGAGAVIHTINYRLTAADIAFQLEHAEATLLLCDVEFLPLALEALEIIDGKHRPTLVEIADASYSKDGVPGAVAATYEELVAAGDAGFALRKPASEHDAISLSYTSGTTGSPKGVVTHHRGAFLASLAWQQGLEMSLRPVFLWVVPLFHCNGWCFPWTMAAQAGVSICQRHAESLLRAMAAHDVTHLAGAPVVMNMLLNAREDLKAPVRARHAARRDGGPDFMVAGAPPPPLLMRQVDAELGIRTRTAYGLTETYGPSTGFLPEHADEAPADHQLIWQAPSLCLAESAVVDPATMERVPEDGETVGEVVLRGNMVMKGYLRNERATMEAFAGGWFRTGDLAVAHPGGRFEIRDRAKDVIISGGENIMSVEVEAALHTHPAVNGVACVAVPDEHWGEAVCAVVELRPAYEGSVTAADLIAHARNLLAHYKAPRVVLFRALPRTATGKIQKHVIRRAVKEEGITGPPPRKLKQQ
ncbi:acyl-CoA synthetase [Tribonema minus]|uniref:Acyl-CoA synthetase n=1 Tax=Tribonema minus TaxID=303371 RepID=A0A835Z8R6_9STRA|nr:acyl-CoA synthetase [Tribonema minus]